MQHRCRILTIRHGTRYDPNDPVRFAVECEDCGRVGVPQLWQVDALAIADRHELMGGFE